MYKVMDDGLCADKDIATIEMARATIIQMTYGLTLDCLPVDFTIKNQRSGETVETQLNSVLLPSNINSS